MWSSLNSDETLEEWSNGVAHFVVVPCDDVERRRQLNIARRHVQVKVHILVRLLEMVDQIFRANGVIVRAHHTERLGALLVRRWAFACNQ